MFDTAWYLLFQTCLGPAVQSASAPTLVPLPPDVVAKPPRRDCSCKDPLHLNEALGRQADGYVQWLSCLQSEVQWARSMAKACQSDPLVPGRVLS